MTNIDGILNKLNTTPTPPDPGAADWSRVIMPRSSYLILGDIGTGKSGLAYWLGETFSADYHLTPATVLPCGAKLPDNWEVLSSPDDCAKMENAVVFIDEADLQLPMNNLKMRDVVLNFLMLPRQRNQIFFLAFHYPRLVMSTFLPSFSGILLKRPPYLLEFAGKSNSKEIRNMMMKAEERFAEMVPPNWAPNPHGGELQHPAVLSHTYVVSPRLRWQGMLANPLPSFWNDDLSCVWKGRQLNIADPTGPTSAPTTALAISPGPVLESWYNEHFTLEELQNLCRQKGLEPLGDSRTLAARIVASEGRPNGT